MATVPQLIDVTFPTGYEFLFEPRRYKVAHGGRGSTKSWSFARALILQAYEKKLRVLCARELQTSISESVHRLLSDQIGLMGLGQWFEIQQQGIYGRNGSEFFFYGIRNNITKVKSAEGIDICWCEEAEKISDNSWQVLIPTVRKANSEIWITFNPDEETDPTYQRFVVNKDHLPGNSAVREFNWHQNPWWWTDNCKSMRDEKDYLYRVDPEAAAHVWGGECRRNASSQIFRGKYAVEAFEVPTDAVVFREQGWDGPYFGIDWGFSGDPAVLVKMWLRGYAKGKSKGTLHIEYSVGGRHIEQDDLGPLFLTVPGVRDRLIYADSARPETISHVKGKTGLRIDPCEKWPECVEDGVEWLRSLERIVIHPRCTNPMSGEKVVDMEQEARWYSYKVDRLTKEVLREIVDKHNHCWDAIRYGLQPLIMRTTSASVWANL
jgi:phage terminase large subunit